MARQDRLDEVDGMDQLDDPLDRSAFSHRNQLAAALSGDGFVDVRTYAVELEAGDRLAIDSDGVHDNLTGSALCALLTSDGEAQDVADGIAGAAWACADCPDSERAKPDDVSVVVLTLDAA
jgi:serine/threonine protein phosphatase PrpC